MKNMRNDKIIVDKLYVTPCGKLKYECVIESVIGEIYRFDYEIVGLYEKENRKTREREIIYKSKS